MKNKIVRVLTAFFDILEIPNIKDIIISITLIDLININRYNRF